MNINEKINTNLNLDFINQVAKKIGLAYVSDTEADGKVCFINNQDVRNEFKISFSTNDIRNYIYAVVHSSEYINQQIHFCETGFPRVPYPTDAETFWQLVELGGQLRQIHLLKSPKVSEFITSYPVDGNNIVTRKMTAKSIGWEPVNAEKNMGRVWINDTQYFDGVPLITWEFFIGGYQPAQKWLKDRHGRTLGFEDILHYQKIIVSLTETHRLMQEIEKIGVEKN